MRIVIQFHPKAPESFETSSKLHSYFILPFETPLTFKNDKGYYRFCKSWGSFGLPKLQRDAGGAKTRTKPDASRRTYEESPDYACNLTDKSATAGCSSKGRQRWYSLATMSSREDTGFC